MNLLRGRQAGRRVQEGLRLFVNLDLSGADEVLRAAVQTARESGSRGILCDSLEAHYRVLRQRRYYDESAAVLSELVRLRTDLYGPDTEPTHAWRNELILLLGRLGRYGEAEAAARDRLASQRRLHGAEAWQTAYGLCTFGWLLREQRRLEEAQGVYTHALDILEKTRGKAHPDLSYALCGLAATRLRQGDYEAAERLLLRARDICDMAGRSEMAAGVRDALTDLYVVSERLKDALTLSENRFGSLVRLSPAEAADRERKAWILERHAFLLRCAERSPDAERFERRAAFLRAAIEAAPSTADGAGGTVDLSGPIFECEPFFGWVSASAPPSRGC